MEIPSDKFSERSMGLSQRREIKIPRHSYAGCRFLAFPVCFFLHGQSIASFGPIGMKLDNTYYQLFTHGMLNVNVSCAFFQLPERWVMTPKVGFKRLLPLIFGIGFHKEQLCSSICSISFLTCDGTRLTLPLWYVSCSVSPVP